MKTGRIGLAVGLVVFLTAMGSGVSYALWSTGASTSATVKAATVAIAVNGTAASSALSVTHQPGQSYTSAVTLTNSGSAAFTYNIAVAPDGGASHSSIAISLWKVASTCDATSTVPTDAWTGTLAGLAAHASEAMTIPGSQVLCVRTSLLGSATSAQNGQIASAKLTFTATNGWTDAKSFKINPSVYVPPQIVLLTGEAGCKDTTNQKSVILGWTTIPGASEYRVYFTPKLLTGASFMVVPQPSQTVVSASVWGESFDTVKGSSDGSGSVSIRYVLNGTESTGLDVPIYFAPNSNGSNTKISCKPIPN